MPNKETLSKHKYIYYVYETADKTIHIEKFPVIYINSKYVYYKRHRKDELDKVYVGYVKDSLADVYNKDYKFISESDRYFWNDVDNAQDVVDMLKKKADEDRIKNNKSWAERDLEYAKKKYEQALEQYNLWKKVSEEKGLD